MTMGSSRLCYYMSILFLIIIISQLYLTHSFSYALPKCHEDDTSALLQFKASLVIDRCVSGDTFSHPKLVSWKLINGENYSNSDCCSWDGVECDEDTSHFVGLHLSSSCLHGSINSSSSLFRLAHLQTLDLANNHFNYSPIPSELGHLSRLTNLNLSQSAFRGQIPSAISKLSKLSSLDLSLNIDSDSLKIMDLSSNRFEGDIPESIGNLKGLNLFNLSNNALRGRIPSSLSNLKKLETLDLSRNNLSGEIPPQLATLTFLGSFSVSHNNLRGPIPTGTQFSTFSYRSFEGNPGLCGMPLPNKCGLVFDTVPPLPSTSEKNGIESLFEFGWRIVLVGYGFGFVLGVVVGNVMISKRHDWFMKTFGRIIRT